MIVGVRRSFWKSMSGRGSSNACCKTTEHVRIAGVHGTAVPANELHKWLADQQEWRQTSANMWPTSSSFTTWSHHGKSQLQTSHCGPSTAWHAERQATFIPAFSHSPFNKCVLTPTPSNRVAWHRTPRYVSVLHAVAGALQKRSGNLDLASLSFHDNVTLITRPNCLARNLLPVLIIHNR